MFECRFHRLRAEKVRYGVNHAVIFWGKDLTAFKFDRTAKVGNTGHLRRFMNNLLQWMMVNHEHLTKDFVAEKNPRFPDF